MKLSGTASALAILAAAGWLATWHFWRAQREAEMRQAATQAELHAAILDGTRKAAQLREAQTQTEAARKQTTTQVAGANARGAAEVRRDNLPIEAQPDYFRRVVEDPEANALYVTQQRYQLRRKYDLLLKKLQLAPANEDRFLGRLVEKRITAMDVANVARANNLAPNDPAVLQGFDSANAESDAAIRNILGDDGFAEYQDFEKNIPQWNALFGLQVQLALDGAALGPAQADVLRHALADLPEPTLPNSTSRSETAAYCADRDAWAQRILDQVGPSLSAEQTIALRNYFEQGAVAMKLRMLIQTSGEGPK